MSSGHFCANARMANAHCALVNAMEDSFWLLLVFGLVLYSTGVLPVRGAPAPDALQRAPERLSAQEAEPQPPLWPSQMFTTSAQDPQRPSGLPPGSV